MSSTKKIVIAAIVVALVGVVWYWWAIYSGTTSNGSSGVAPASGSGAQNFSPTHSAVPAGSVVPQKGGVGVGASVAVPVVQGPGDPAGNVDYRSFTLSIQSNAFSPDTVIVNQGDTVNLEITAIDANYEFTQPDYGFNDAIKKGKTQRIQFQALQSGDFTFYCESCGGPSKGPVGHLIVVAQQ